MSTLKSLYKYAVIRKIWPFLDVFDGKGGNFMAKKKKRKRRRSDALKTITASYDKHHLLWQERYWSRGSLLKLRQFHYCVILLQRDTLHRFIHANMAGIPVPTEKNANFVLDQLRMLEDYGAISDEDTIEKRLVVLASLFDCSEQPTADAIRKQLQIVYRFKNEPP